MLKRITSIFFTKGLVALINLSVLLLTSKHLGASVIGQMSLIILNISIIQTINESYTGSALVYFIPKISIKKVYAIGFIWTFTAVVLVNLVFGFFKIGLQEFCLHTAILSFLLILHSFHMVILLAKQKIKTYNFLMFFQVFLLLTTLLIGIFLFHQKDIYTYVYALYIAYGTVLFLSSISLRRVLSFDQNNGIPNTWAMFKIGITNQLGNLAHTLSNRFNYYMIGSSVLVGIYANSSSLIESIWIISGSAAPMVLSHVANSEDKHTDGALVFNIAKICFLLSLFCVLLLFFLPNALFVYFLGSDFVDTKQFMLYLSPGILAISFSTIISHYFSGIGQQRVQLVANLAGLGCTLLLSAFMIGRFGLKGACLTASLSYFVQAFILFVVFIKTQGIGLKALWAFKT